MSGSPKTLRLTACADNQVVNKSPTPPADLWERMDAEVLPQIEGPPADSFTQKQFQARYPKLTDDRARHLLDKLQADGVIKLVGRYGSNREKHFIHITNDNEAS